MKYIVKYSVAGLLCLVLSACATPPKTDIDPNVDFSNYQSFTWQFQEDSKERKVSDPVYDSPLFEKKLEKAVTQAMLRYGFVNSDKPDMLLSYHMADQERKQLPFNVSLGYGRYSRHSSWNIFSPHLHRLQRDDVLLIIDVSDAETNELMWRGWTKTRKRSTPPSSEDIAIFADKIMSAFPR